MAINSFNNPEVLIAGGLDRGFEFDDLVIALKEHVSKIVLYGETKELMAKAAKQAGLSDISIVDTLEQAVPLAFEKKVVLVKSFCFHRPLLVGINSIVLKNVAIVL